MPGARRSVSSARDPATATGQAHQLAVARLLASYRAVPATATVRLAKKTSNLFRVRRPTTVTGLDVTGLAGVLSIDPAARTADVAGMCTYETLVAATLPHGLSPLVVPQLKTITVGGAVTGLGIESASFRNGLVHESVLEMDILTGAGEMVTASPDNEHADLLFGFPNSFGTLGYATRIRIQLEPVEPYVALRHLRFTDLDRLTATVDDIVATGAHDGIGVDYLDGVVFTADESYLTLGLQTADPGPTSDYTRQQIYYRSIRERTTDRLTINDYLGAGIPTGSGAREPSASSSRWSGGSGRGGCGAARSTGNSLLWNGSTVSPTGSRTSTVARRWSGWCRMWRFRWRAPRISSPGSWTRCPSNRCGCARSAPGLRRARVPRGSGRCIRWEPTAPTSTSGSGRWCRVGPAVRRGRRTG